MFLRLTDNASGLIRLLALVGVVVTLAAGCGNPGASVAFTEKTPADLRELVVSVWDDFVAVFPSQEECIGEVTVAGDWTLEGSRAYYLPEDAKVVLKIPATAAHLRHSLVHELAHHLEHSCPTHSDWRQAFLEAQGASADTPWFEGPSWEETPSEQYAEAVVRVVLERPVFFYQMPIKSEALRVVKEWGGAD